MLDKRHAGHVYGTEQSADRYGGGALNIVVEGAELIAVTRQEPVGVADREILPMQENVRPPFTDGVDKGGDEGVIIGAAHALVPPPDVERIGQMILIVRSDIEHDRQRGRRMKAGARRVQRELADRNAHAAGALIAEPENALAVADHNGLDAIEARVAEDAAYGSLMLQAEKQAARFAKNAAELLAA